MSQPNKKVLDSIVLRAHYLANQMIYLANHRDNKQKGDPKVGGHSSGSTSAIHILGALHLVAKTGFDHIANKPHASPADHSYNYLLDMFLKEDLSKLSLEDANTAMQGLRAFSQNGEPVFQSYHSAFDPDHHNFFPSGTVGIPPVNAGYLGLAYRYARNHGYTVPDAHFWCIIGDSEFREGSLFEAIPDFAERQLGNLTWIVDYNRQSLDGHRISNPSIMGGTDNERIANTMKANGWDVIQVRHGKKREQLFKQNDGKKFETWLDDELTDYELQAILLLESPEKLKKHIEKEHKHLKAFVKNISAEDLYEAMHDMGGHDIIALAEAMQKSKENPDRPTMIVAHTIKGWKLNMAGVSGNHSMIPDQTEMDQLKSQTGVDADQLFQRFDQKSPEGQFLKKRGDQIYKEIQEQHEIKKNNQTYFMERTAQLGEIPNTLDINLKMASYPHTQWMLGQLTSKLTRIANTPLDEKKLKEKQKPLNDFEKSWKTPAELIVSMAPDVGTSTNLNPSMDGKIFASEIVDDIEAELGVKDQKTPDLIPGEQESDRFIRFEIAEANTTSCLGSFGRMRDLLGVPLIPLMTVYDFFIKRALDQHFYNLYWKSSFILVGTPSGVTLSPEGAQHGWKSDIQIPNQITWEPLYCVELDWILCESAKRHIENDNDGRSGVLIRGVTRGIEQKDMMKLLKTQARFKEGFTDQHLLSHKDFPLEGANPENDFPTLSDEDILATIKSEALAGAYYLINYKGYAGYEPGDNVVNIFAMGPMGVEAIEASKQLLERGIYANVIVVTSPDLLVGNLAHENNYAHLKYTLGVNADLILHEVPKSLEDSSAVNSGQLKTIAGRRVPIVSVHDGEPGILDNIGSILGVRHHSLAVRKHSKCGRPVDVYKYHGIDADSIVEACGQTLAETALEQVQASSGLLQDTFSSPQLQGDWRELWPTQKND